MPVSAWRTYCRPDGLYTLVRWDRDQVGRPLARRRGSLGRVGEGHESPSCHLEVDTARGWSEDAETPSTILGCNLLDRMSVRVCPR